MSVIPQGAPYQGRLLSGRRNLLNQNQRIKLQKNTPHFTKLPKAVLKAAGCSQFICSVSRRSCAPGWHLGVTFLCLEVAWKRPAVAGRYFSVPLSGYQGLERGVSWCGVTEEAGWLTEASRPLPVAQLWEFPCRQWEQARVHIRTACPSARSFPWVLLCLSPAGWNASSLGSGTFLFEFSV